MCRLNTERLLTHIYICLYRKNLRVTTKRCCPRAVGGQKRYQNMQIDVHYPKRCRCARIYKRLTRTYGTMYMRSPNGMFPVLKKNMKNEESTRAYTEAQGMMKKL